MFCPHEAGSTWVPLGRVDLSYGVAAEKQPGDPWSKWKKTDLGGTMPNPSINPHTPWYLHPTWDFTTTGADGFREKGPLQLKLPDSILEGETGEGTVCAVITPPKTQDGVTVKLLCWDPLHLDPGQVTISPSLTPPILSPAFHVTAGGDQTKREGVRPTAISAESDGYWSATRRIPVRDKVGPP
jgi:hypothetical protein